MISKIFSAKKIAKIWRFFDSNQTHLVTLIEGLTHNKKMFHVGIYCCCRAAKDFFPMPFIVLLP
jgi:ferredoxin-thioredoxin reductase catalytic subunit